MADGHLFTNFVKENRPLSFLLERVFAGPLLDRIRQSSLVELDGEIDALVNELITRVRVDPPVLGATRAVRVTDGIARPAREAGVTQPTSRFHSAIQVRGDAELLRAWPHQSGMHLPAVDEVHGDPFADRRRDGPWDYETELRVYEYLVARELWFLTAVEGSDELVLCTFVELTVEDEQRV